MERQFNQLPQSLPGAEILLPGYQDLNDHKESIGSLLLSMAKVNLSDLGFSLPMSFKNPETRLYRLLQKEHGDEAHSRYNSLVRLLIRDVKF